MHGVDDKTEELEIELSDFLTLYSTNRLRVNNYSFPFASGIFVRDVKFSI